MTSSIGDKGSSATRIATEQTTPSPALPADFLDAPAWLVLNHVIKT
jgi:hypothetical protein